LWTCLIFEIGVSNVFANERKLESETRSLQAQSAKFAKLTGQWLQMVENFNVALKVFNTLFISDHQEIGDVENWGKTIETDMKGILATLEYLEKQQAPQQYQ
jgi:hypothetical protein